MTNEQILSAFVPLGVPISDCYRLCIDTSAVDIARARLSDFAICAAGADRQIEVEVNRPICDEDVKLLPKSSAPDVTVDGNRIRFQVSGVRQLHLEVAGLPDLLIVMHAMPQEPTENVVRFRPGLHRRGLLRVESGQTVWLDAGAVLQAHIIAEDAEGIRVAGPGVLDGSPYPKGAIIESNHMMRFLHCRDVHVEGVTVINSCGWNIVPVSCDQLRIQSIQILGPNVTSDGIDVCASRDVLIEDCYLRNNDDCVVIKGPKQHAQRAAENNWDTNVKNVLVQRCICYNEPAGNVFEIGFETNCDSIRNIVFRDCDVLAGHGQGGVFTIHAGDRAVIEDVVYEDIRIEHFYDRFIDVTIFPSRYSVDDERGRVRNVQLRNVQACEDLYNTPSLIGGWDAEHDISGIHLHQVYMGDRHIDSLDALHGFLRHASNVTFD